MPGIVDEDVDRAEVLFAEISRSRGMRQGKQRGQDAVSGAVR
jgi:hypothetical protein